MHLGLFGCLTKLGAERAELMQKFMPRSRIGIFRDECTRSDPLDPKLMFWYVSYYLGAFGTVFCPTRLSAKRVNWCNCSCHKVALEFFATNAPDPPHSSLNSCFGAFRTIWVHLGQFGGITNLGTKQAELGQKFLHRSRVGMVRNECTRSSPLDPKLMFWRISYHLGAFGTIMLPY